MQRKLLEILVCPYCLQALACCATAVVDSAEIDAGELSCHACQRSYPIVNGIPRFVASHNYASSFGYQWNEFRREQMDSFNGTRLSEARFYAETAWGREWMGGKWLLEGGCGAGRFVDVAAKTGCEIVGVDLSNAVDAARNSLARRANVHLVQASIYELPFRPGTFDGCYSIGVLQHTPAPQQALQALARVLRPNGKLAVTIYERKPWTPFYSKYLWRLLTRRIEQRRLLELIKLAMPVLFVLTDALYRIPLLGRVFMFLIPVANYVNEKSLTRQQRYAWSVLDTFDMLAPAYDQPQTQEEAEAALAEAGMAEITRTTVPGLNIIGRKA